MLKSIIILLATFFFSLTSSVVLKAIEAKSFSNQEDILILNLFANGFNTENSIVAYLDKDNVFISVIELSSYLRFKIKAYNLFSLRGWYQNPENQVTIDIDKNSITSKYKTIQFSKDDVIVNDGVLFLSKSLIEKIFNLKLNIDINKLTIDAISNQEFYIEAEYKKERGRNEVQNQIDSKLLSEEYNMDDRMFSIPSLDFYGSTSYHRDGSSNTYTNLNLAGIFAGFDSNVSISKEYQRYTEEASPIKKTHDTDVRIRVSKTSVDDKDRVLGFSYFTAGDIYSTSSNLLTKSQNGRGLYFSTNTDYAINEDQTVTLEGAVQTGWEIELYQNDQLLAFTTDTSEGRYLFENVPVNYGVNIFKVIFYGPFGERREETRKFIIGNMPASKGKVSAKLSFIQTDRNLIEAGSDIEKNKVDSINIPLVSLSYGLTDFSAISTTYTRQENLQTKKLENLINAGISLNREALGVEYYLGQNLAQPNRYAHNLLLSNSTDIGNFFVNYESYNGIRSNRSYVLEDVYISSIAELRYNYFFNIKNFNLPTVLNIKQTNYENDNSYDVDYENRIIASVSHAFLGQQYITMENIYTDFYKIDKSSESYNDISLILSSNFWGSNLRIQSQYNTKPYKELSIIAAKIDRRLFNNNLYTYLDYSRTFYYLNNTALDKLEAGLSVSTSNYGSFRFATGGYSTGDRYVTASYFYNLRI